MASKDVYTAHVHEMHELLATAEARSQSGDMEKAVWLVENGIPVTIVADYFHVPAVSIKPGKTSAEHHIGRPRLLHEGSEALLHDKIEEAFIAGAPLTRAECLTHANEIYLEQMKVDLANGLLSPEKASELSTGEPHLSASFINTFLHRHPDLHVKNTRGTTTADRVQ